MYLVKPNKYEIRHRALLEEVRFCGGVSGYSRMLKVSRSRASNWLNQTEIDIPYEFAILTEDITNISVERLRRKCDEVAKSRETKIASMLGLTSRDLYYRAKKIYLSFNHELINQVDQQQVFLAMGERLAKRQYKFNHDVNEEGVKLYDAKNQNS